MATIRDLPRELLFYIAAIDVETYRGLLCILGLDTLGKENQTWIRSLFHRVQTTCEPYEAGLTKKTVEHFLCNRAADYMGNPARESVVLTRDTTEKLKVKKIKTLAQIGGPSLTSRYCTRYIREFVKVNEKILRGGNLAYLRREWAKTKFFIEVEIKYDYVGITCGTIDSKKTRKISCSRGEISVYTSYCYKAGPVCTAVGDRKSEDHLFSITNKQE